MKKQLMTLSLALTALVISNNIQAYSWPMYNATNKRLLIQVVLYPDYEVNLDTAIPFFVLVEPGKTADFSWPFGNTRAGFCFQNAVHTIADDNLLSELRKRHLVDDNGKVTDNSKIREYLISAKVSRTTASQTGAVVFVSQQCYD